MTLADTAIGKASRETLPLQLPASAPGARFIRHADFLYPIGSHQFPIFS